MLLSEFDFEFSYLEGSKNHLADALSRAVDFPPEAWTVVGAPDTRGIDVDDETFNFPIGRRPIDTWPALGMSALQLLPADDAEYYLLKPRTEATSGDFIEPTFFGYVQEASGDDDRFVTDEGDVYIRTDYDESLDMPHKAFNELEKAIFGVATVELKERPMFTSGTLERRECRS